MYSIDMFAHRNNILLIFTVLFVGLYKFEILWNLLGAKAISVATQFKQEKEWDLSYKFEGLRSNPNKIDESFLRFSEAFQKKKVKPFSSSTRSSKGD